MKKDLLKIEDYIHISKIKGSFPKQRFYPYLQIHISGRAYHTESYRNREGKLRSKEIDTFNGRYYHW